MHDRYPLKPFRIAEPGLLLRIMREIPLATLMSGSAGAAEMTLLPLLSDAGADGRIRLAGHLDRNNPHAAKLSPGEPVSFAFQGPSAYASPDLYPDAQLPGWLYVMVKGQGIVACHQRDDALLASLCRASANFGGARQRFQLSENDPRISQFLGGILGFEIDVQNASGIAKLAQDKGPSHAGLAGRFLAAQTNAQFAALFHDLLRPAASE